MEAKDARPGKDVLGVRGMEELKSGEKFDVVYGELPSMVSIWDEKFGIWPALDKNQLAVSYHL